MKNPLGSRASMEPTGRKGGRMSVIKEFETVSLLLRSRAKTRGVDAFALSLIKTERQIRRLFTHLVFQFPEFGAGDGVRLMQVLAGKRRVYFDGFIAGIDALYPRSLASIIGAADYARLKVRVEEATQHRNKIFHGQLTGHSLTRPELLSLVEDIREWCERLGEGAMAEFRYDGFGRNAFRKSAVADLWVRYKYRIESLSDYGNFIDRHMTRR
jgi:hypothetical protein